MSLFKNLICPLCKLCFIIDFITYEVMKSMIKHSIMLLCQIHYKTHHNVHNINGFENCQKMLFSRKYLVFNASNRKMPTNKNGSKLALLCVCQV